MGFAQDLVRRADTQPIKGAYLLGCWLRDDMPEDKAAVVLRVVDEKLKGIHTTPEFVLTHSDEHTLHVHSAELDLRVVMRPGFFEVTDDRAAHALLDEVLEPMLQADLF